MRAQRIRKGGMKDRHGNLIVEEYYSLLERDLMPRQETGIPSSAHHERLNEFSGRMVLEIKAVSKVFVGTGDYELDANSIYHPFASTGGLNKKLIIPGTCIKGVVRTYAEALSPSCEGGRYRGRECGECICCSIFGALGFQGRATFCDTEPLDPVDKTDIYTMSVRWQGRKHDGRRFYFHQKPASSRLINPWTNTLLPDERVEVVVEGTCFTSELLFENLSRLEIGLLLLAMGLAPNYQFHLKLGGGKNRGLGRVRFRLPNGIEVVTANPYGTFSLHYDPKPIADWGEESILAYWDWLHGLDPNDYRRIAEANIQAFQRDP